MTMVGIGYRRSIAQWIDKNPNLVQCMEITAEHFFGREKIVLDRLSQKAPLYVHGLGLSLGTPGPMDEELLLNFNRVAQAVMWSILRKKTTPVIIIRMAKYPKFLMSYKK